MTMLTCPHPGSDTGASSTETRLRTAVGAQDRRSSTETIRYSQQEFQQKLMRRNAHQAGSDAAENARPEERA